MKGIILAGGSGSRLSPLTKSISKQIIPLYDKPMIYYPLSVLMLAEINEVLIISTPRDIQLFENLFGNGSQFGMKFEYAVQEAPNGLAEAFIISESFISNDSCCLILGDNVFYGHGLTPILLEAKKSITKNSGAVVFGYYVKNPSEYGVVEFDGFGNAISIEEKPKKPKSNYAVPGLYFYDNDVIEIAKNIKPSARGELEITSVNIAYLNNRKLKVEKLGRGMAWLDTGTFSGLLDAANFIATVQERQGLYVSCIEEIAYLKGWINLQQLLEFAKLYNNEYGSYLKYIAAVKHF